MTTPPAPPSSAETAPSSAAPRTSRPRAERALLIFGTALLAASLLLLGLALVQRDARLTPFTLHLNTHSRPDFGNRAAPAAAEVLIFGDFQCPFCQRFHRDTLPGLKKLITARGGRLVYAQRVLFGAPSFRLAAASECAFILAGRGGYERLSDRLYREGEKWGEKDSGWTVSPLLTPLFREVGLDAPGMITCMLQPARMTLIEQESAAIARAGGNTTPGVVVGGVSVPVPTLANIVAALDRSHQGR